MSTRYGCSIGTYPATVRLRLLRLFFSPGLTRRMTRANNERPASTSFARWTKTACPAVSCSRQSTRRHLVSLVVALDAGPLGLVTNPKRSPESLACAQWLQALVAAGVRVVLPEITDYEVRRELLRGRRQQGLRRLDELIATIGSTDGVVAMTNVGHLSRYVQAALWRDIRNA